MACARVTATGPIPCCDILSRLVKNLLVPETPVSARSLAMISGLLEGAKVD
jgi:hypothetical protein